MQDVQDVVKEFLGDWKGLLLGTDKYDYSEIVVQRSLLLARYVTVNGILQLIRMLKELDVINVINQREKTLSQYSRNDGVEC